MLAPSIAVMPIPNDGLGEAIDERLRRAAAAGSRIILVEMPMLTPDKDLITTAHRDRR